MTKEEPLSYYITVHFGDNDFGWCVESALKRIWAWVDEKRNYQLAINKRTIVHMLDHLRHTGWLSKFIIQMIDIENAAFNVEGGLRCGVGGGAFASLPYEHDTHQREEFDNFGTRVTTYLRPVICFRKGEKFKKKWANGKAYFLNIETGEVGSW